ncbi:phosphate acetyltransferase [Candidatus Annandia adelgestsuga]|uniref:phosphate acetyltransferase n=1 Tax=Candidatus Annandia adelgestsuga TaxID=1302411 RepID=UPI002A4E1767|nr:phosphate acetyltransferase [Candidatus Annandia adelgestsuga]
MLKNIIFKLNFSKKNMTKNNNFIKKLILLSSKNKKKIILPEGENYKIIKAAYICSKYEIADCILIGSKKKIYNIAKKNDIEFKKYNLKIINPKYIYKNYIDRYVELRKHKGMTKNIAKNDLKNNIILSTLILENNEVDGLVSGIENTTANTIRPALQLIKTKENCSLISSAFFVLLNNNVCIYSDCAINVNPDKYQLAEIAIQTANTAIKFNILPKIAMLSYSTGISGSGIEVEKVLHATNIVKNKRPDLIIEGPIQYDAAVSKKISYIKNKNSILSGCANIFIFPELNSGNITYKAVQRTSKVTFIGPILQGVKKNISDLSRGASMKEILYTIALTSIL